MIKPPCVTGTCPHNAYNGMDCRNYCGIGVDENEYPEADDLEYPSEDFDSCDRRCHTDGLYCERWHTCSIITMLGI